MVGLAAAVIDAVGDEVDVAFDCHWRYQVSDAQRLAHELEQLGLMWLEDPVPPENVQALARVTKSTTTPIATGENGYMRHGFREAFECGAIDVAAPDPQKTGGLLETRRIADYADTHYISMAPHCIASPIGTVANVHVARRDPELPRAGVARDERPVLERPRGRLGRAGDRRRAHQGARQARPGRDAEPRPRAPVRAPRRAVLRRVMIAATYSETGASDVLDRRRGRDARSPARARCACELAVAGVNPTDWKSRAGATGALNFDFQVPGQDGAGVIDAVGEGVAKAWVGERVWVYLAGWQSPVGHGGAVHGRAGREGGAAGRRVLRRSARRSACPRSPPTTACSPTARSRASAVLVAGGAGAVGHAAIELAKWGGAEVVTTVSQRRRRPSWRARADVIVNYREDGAAEQIGKVDRIVEVALGPNLELDLAVANAARDDRHLRGRHADGRDPDPAADDARTSTLRFMLLYTIPQARRWRPRSAASRRRSTRAR